MKSALGLLLIIVGVALGLYAGLWWAFIGGIVQIVDALKVTPTPAFDIAFGIARIMFAGFIGVVSAMTLVIPGFVMVTD